MRATVTQSFVGRRDHLFETETLKVGDLIEGELAAVAVEQGWAKDEGKAGKTKAKSEKADSAQTDGQDQKPDGEQSGDTDKKPETPEA